MMRLQWLEKCTNIQTLAQTAKDTEQLATSTMAASGDLSSQSGLLTREIKDLSGSRAGKLVDSGGARRSARCASGLIPAAKKVEQAKAQLRKTILQSFRR